MYRQTEVATEVVELNLFPIDLQALEGLAEETVENGGFTRHVVNGHAPDVGYVVSPYQERGVTIPIDEITDDDVFAFATANVDLLARDDHYLGGWADDGLVYLDISIVLGDRTEALLVAREHEQLAIWDLERGEEIRTDWTGI